MWRVPPPFSSVPLPVHTDACPQLKYKSSSTCISECGTPSWACLFLLSQEKAISSFLSHVSRQSNFVIFFFPLKHPWNFIERPLKHPWNNSENKISLVTNECTNTLQLLLIAAENKHFFYVKRRLKYFWKHCTPQTRIIGPFLTPSQFFEK